MQDPAYRANGIVMIGLLVAGACMSAYVLVTPELRAAVSKPLAPYQYVDGKITATIESTYEDELPLRAPSSAMLNALTLALFGEGRKGVVIGEAGWLFSAEEYDWTPQSPTHLAENLAYVAEVAATLAAQGIALEIALLPEKADIYADHLGKPRPLAHAGKYARVRDALLATGATVPDLREALREARRTQTVFFPTDTHWSVAGSGIVAEALAQVFPARDTVPAQAFELKTAPAVHHAGDLASFVELGPFAALLPATPDSVEAITAISTGGSVDDFLAEDAAHTDPLIALVGTSYSAAPLWSFESQLKAALGADLVNFAQEGLGPFLPMRDFLEKLSAGAISPRAVIWEIPLRYLDDDASAAPTPSSSAV